MERSPSAWGKIMASHLENQFTQLWRYYHPSIELQQEYRFAPPRRYRADFCHPASKVIIEIQGGIWGKKRTGHSTGSGIEGDCEKLCYATSLGWAVFPLTERMISEEWCRTIARTIQRRSRAIL